MAGFFSFRSLVSTSIIKVTYFSGLLAITGIGIVAILAGMFWLISQHSGDSRLFVANVTTQPIALIVFGIVAISFGNLFWRLMCEAWILIFSMHEMLASIERSVAISEQGESAGYHRVVT